MASSSSFTLKSYGGDSAAKPLTGCQTKVAQHVVKYGGGGAAYALGWGGNPPSPWLAATYNTQAKSFLRKTKGILLWEVIRCADVLRGGRRESV